MSHASQSVAVDGCCGRIYQLSGWSRRGPRNGSATRVCGKKRRLRPMNGVEALPTECERPSGPACHGLSFETVVRVSAVKDRSRRCAGVWPSRARRAQSAGAAPSGGHRTPARRGASQNGQTRLQRDEVLVEGREVEIQQLLQFRSCDRGEGSDLLPRISLAEDGERLDRWWTRTLNAVNSATNRRRCQRRVIRESSRCMSPAPATTGLVADVRDRRWPELRWRIPRSARSTACAWLRDAKPPSTRTIRPDP